MTKIKFNIGGIVVDLKPKKNNGLLLKILLTCLGIYLTSFLAVLNGDFFVHTLTSVTNAFNTFSFAPEPINPVRLNYDKNIIFTYKPAPILYAVPNSKIENALTLGFFNTNLPFEIKNINISLRSTPCDIIKKPKLTADDGVVFEGFCKNDKLSFVNMNDSVEKNQKRKYVLEFALSKETKIGQHLNFFIENPRDFEIYDGNKNIYIDSLYPMKLGTMYVVGMKYLFD